MRVIAGAAKGRRLQAGKGQAIRPTGSKVRGAIFSILESRFALADATVLDLFAGAGSLGIEALSRGAAHVTFVDRDAGAARILRANLEHCGFAARARVLELPLPQGLRRLGASRFDGAFLDPPYGKGLIEPTLAELGRLGQLSSGAWIVVEHPVEEPLRESYGPLRLTLARRYGKTALAIFSCDGEVKLTSTQR